MVKRKRPRAPAGKIRVTLYIDKGTAYILRVTAAHHRTSMTALVEGALKRDKLWKESPLPLLTIGNKEA